MSLLDGEGVDAFERHCVEWVREKPSLDIADENAVQDAIDLVDIAVARGSLPVSESLAALFANSFDEFSWIYTADFLEVLKPLQWCIMDRCDTTLLASSVCMSKRAMRAGQRAGPLPARHRRKDHFLPGS